MINFDINQNIESQFDNIARQLFNETSLIVNDQEYLLTEFEFYVHGAAHPDPFVHQHILQKTSNQWYFHGSGVDITIGDEQTYGGILLRGLKAARKDEAPRYIDGPLNILREIFKHINLHKSQQIFGLDKSEYFENKIFKSTRIGLNPAGKEEGDKYFVKNYRYLIDLITEHKYKEKEKIKKYKQEV